MTTNNSGYASIIHYMDYTNISGSSRKSNSQ